MIDNALRKLTVLKLVSICLDVQADSFYEINRSRNE